MYAKSRLLKCPKCGKNSIRFSSYRQAYVCVNDSCGKESTLSEILHIGRESISSPWHGRGLDSAVPGSASKPMVSQECMPQPSLHLSRESVASIPAFTERPQQKQPVILLNKRYHIEKQLAVGGMAVISLARDTQTDSICVVKTPRSDTRHSPKLNVDKLMLEAAYLRQFNHPHIVKFVDLFTVDGVLHLVVDYVEGQNLHTACAALPAPENRVLKWAAQILDALEYIHGSGMVHRDMNPNNVMLKPDDSVVIVDFGTLKPGGIAGTTVGTPGFEVPEQVARGFADARSDIYAVGGILFYALTCAPPGFIGKGDISTLLTEKGISQRSAQCINQALRIDADARFQSANAMRKALCGERF